MVIRQKGQPISLYSRKLTVTPKRYTVIEGELLIIIETLKEFRTIFIGQILRIYSNTKKLTCNNFNTDRILICILILEE